MFLLTCLLASPAHAETPPREVLLEVRDAQQRIDRIGMSTLGGWAVANMAAGTAGWFVADDPEWAWFHLSNAGWNTVNLGLAASGLIGARRAQASRSEPAWPALPLESARMRAIFLFNGGLDFGYMAGGGLLWQRGIYEDDPRLVGMGKSVVLQGAFLLAFDLTMATLKWRADAPLDIYLDPGGLTVRF